MAYSEDDSKHVLPATFTLLFTHPSHSHWKGKQETWTRYPYSFPAPPHLLASHSVAPSWARLILSLSPLKPTNLSYTFRVKPVVWIVSLEVDIPEDSYRKTLALGSISMVSGEFLVEIVLRSNSFAERMEEPIMKQELPWVKAS